jgi:hypothetical protein
MQMDFKKMSYHSEMTLYVNVAGVLTGSGSNNLAGTSVMHIEPGKWYLHMGTPTNPIGLKFIGLMTVNGYFMAGHDIPDAMTLPQQVVDDIRTSTSKNSRTNEAPAIWQPVPDWLLVPVLRSIRATKSF